MASMRHILEENNVFEEMEISINMLIDQFIKDEITYPVFPFKHDGVEIYNASGKDLRVALFRLNDLIHLENISGRIEYTDEAKTYFYMLLNLLKLDIMIDLYTRETCSIERPHLSPILDQNSEGILSATSYCKRVIIIILENAIDDTLYKGIPVSDGYSFTIPGKIRRVLSINKSKLIKNTKDKG